MTVPQSLAGRTMLVTGASSGIGKAIALGAARAGADVAITYRTNDEGAREVERAIRDLGRKSAVIRLDVANDASMHALGPAVRTALGRVDAWVNNAGADILTGPAASLSDAERLDLLLAVDLRGTIHASWCAAELLGDQDEGGVIDGDSGTRRFPGEQARGGAQQISGVHQDNAAVHAFHPLSGTSGSGKGPDRGLFRVSFESARPREG